MSNQVLHMKQRRYMMRYRLLIDTRPPILHGIGKAKVQYLRGTW
jgi:hypothetical protein